MAAQGQEESKLQLACADKGGDNMMGKYNFLFGANIR